MTATKSLALFGFWVLAAPVWAEDDDKSDVMTCDELYAIYHWDFVRR